MRSCFMEQPPGTLSQFRSAYNDAMSVFSPGTRGKGTVMAQDELNAMQQHPGYQGYVDRLARYLTILSQLSSLSDALAQIRGSEMDLVKHLVTQCMSEMRNAGKPVAFSDHVEFYVAWLLVDAKKRAEELAAHGDVPRTEAEEHAI